MELKLRNGDYVPDGVGGLRAAHGQEALLQRILYRLTARRGQFPFCETLGSRLWQLGRLPAAERQSAAKQYVAEALAEENVQVRTVVLTQNENGTTDLKAELEWQGEPLELTLPMQM